jgi:phosphopantetheinyl transferase
MPQIDFPLLERDDVVAALARHQARLYFWHVTETAGELASLLPAAYDYVAEAQQRFRTPHRRSEWLAARVLLHAVAGVKERMTYINERPVLVGGPFRISISHTDDKVCLLLSPDAVGVDIEHYGARAYALRERFLSAAELPLLADVSVAATPVAAAVLLWSAKEAAFKALSADGVQLLSQIHLHATPSRRLLATAVRDNGAELRREVVLVEEKDFAWAFAAPMREG